MTIARSAFAMLTAALLILSPATRGLGQSPATPPSSGKVHKLAIQVDENKPEIMNLALNNAQNVLDHFKAKGEPVAIEIVTYGPGLHMLRDDTTPVKPRLQSFKQGMPNVSFMACENTLEAMTRTEGKEPPLVENATRVPAGVVTLMELGEKGWTIVRP